MKKTNNKKKHIRLSIYLKLKIIGNWESIWRKYSTIQSWLGLATVWLLLIAL